MVNAYGMETCMSLEGVWKAAKAQLDSDGFTAPMPLARPDVLETVIREFHDSIVYNRNPHVTSEAVRTLVFDPGIRQALSTLCGDDFMLWRSAMFVKAPGGKEIGWHHDKHFSDGDAPVELNLDDRHYSVFIAITDVGAEDGCLEMLPGSHRETLGIERDVRPFHKRPASDHILPALPADNADDIIASPVPAGHFIIFHSALLHRSRENLSDTTRLGLAFRLAPAQRDIPLDLAQPGEVTPYSQPELEA